MLIKKNPLGLFVFDVKVRGPRKTRNLKGLIDTGSTDCAAMFEVITTLWQRPIDFTFVSTINNQSKRCLVYSMYVGFDGRMEMTPVIRVDNFPKGIHFLLGMSILSKCKLISGKNSLKIEWL